MSRDWTFHGFASEFDGHVRAQLPWYPLATAAMSIVARHYIPPRGGLVYDIGCSTGNVGRALADTLEARQCRLVALDESPDMVSSYDAPGSVQRANAAFFDYEPFDLAVCFLTLMFLTVAERRELLTRLRRNLKPGGAIFVMDKQTAPGGYPGTIFARLTWEGKFAQGVDPASIVEKEISLAGVQRPLYPGELGRNAVEVVRFGDFAGWLIEA